MDPNTGDGSDFGYLEALSDIGCSLNDFSECGREKTLHGCFYIFYRFVDHAVCANLDGVFISKVSGFRVWPNIESNDDSAIGLSQGDIRFGDATNGGMEEFDVRPFDVDLVK